MSEVKKEAEQLVLKNARVKYAKVIRPGKAYDESQSDLWSVNMYLTDADREALMARGINPKEDKEGNEYWVAKRNTVNKSGAPVQPPALFTASKAPWPGDDIGNGSVCNIAVTLFPWQKSKTQKGTLLYLNAMQVVNHVPYTQGGADQFEAVDGNTEGDANPFG
jgi:hypothetical protein